MSKKVAKAKQTEKKEKTEKKQKTKGLISIILSFLKYSIIILFSFVIVIAGVSLGYLASIWITSPSLDLERLNPPLTSYLYDNEGNLIAELHGEQNRIEVSLDSIPVNVQNAFIAVEDVRFREHQGFDLRALSRALKANIEAGRIEQGGSTITQQLVRNVFLTGEKTLERKIHEIRLAYELEKRFSKNKILELYLNWIYFGKNAYGIEAAAWTFFDKPASELSLAEGAFLAALPVRPSSLSSEAEMQRVKDRQATILSLISSHGLARTADIIAAKDEELEIKINEPKKYDYPNFTDYVVHRELIEILSNIPEYSANPYEAIYGGGLKVYTTLDPSAQSLAEEVVNKDNYYPQSLRDKNGVLQPQAAMVVAEIETGHISALVGGRDYGPHNQNLRYLSRRRPGSAIKPLVSYGPAIELGLITPNSIVQDTPVEFIIPGERNYAPKNYDRSYRGNVTVRTALAMSYNIPAVRIFDQVGIEYAIDFAKLLGIKTFVGKNNFPNDYNLATSLGGMTYGVRALDMAQAYSVFANDGKKINHTSVLRIEDRHGAIIYEHDPKEQQIIRAETARMINDMLIDAARWGTGNNLRLDRPLAAKTGTSSDYLDGYLVAYTADYVLSFWMGYDQEDGRVQRPWLYTARFANDVMQSIHQGKPVRQLPR